MASFRKILGSCDITSGVDVPSFATVTLAIRLTGFGRKWSRTLCVYIGYYRRKRRNQHFPMLNESSFKFEQKNFGAQGTTALASCLPCVRVTLHQERHARPAAGSSKSAPWNSLVPTSYQVCRCLLPRVLTPWLKIRGPFATGPRVFQLTVLG